MSCTAQITDLGKLGYQDALERQLEIHDQVVKQRELWRPFCPSILEDRAAEYFKECTKSPYMTMAFDSTDIGKKSIPAALHPYDKTARPNIVTNV